MPSGHFQTFMLSDAPEQNVYSFGWKASERTDFLWFVNVEIHLPVDKSHYLIMASYDPLTIYGSNLR